MIHRLFNVNMAEWKWRERKEDQGYCQAHKCLWRHGCLTYPNNLIQELGETEVIKYKDELWRCEDYRTKSGEL